MSSGEKVIVSLTSFPAAIPYVLPTVRSILAGSVLPDKVVLYLTTSQFSDKSLPNELVQMVKENPIFEIRFYDPPIRSYTKLIPALIDFPESVIVTVDDDIIYEKHMLAKLLAWHKRYPEFILAHRVRRIILDAPYSRWKKYKWYNFVLKRLHPGYKNLLTGVGGVLYPPGALKKEMLKEELFTKLAPTADDFWFWAAAVANGTKIMPIPFGYNRPYEVGKPREISLMSINYKSGVDRNMEVLKAILSTYPEIKNRIDNE